MGILRLRAAGAHMGKNEQLTRVHFHSSTLYKYDMAQEIKIALAVAPPHCGAFVCVTCTEAIHKQRN